jgi:hypothetical protein
LYFAAPKQQMMPDEKYPDPSQQQVGYVFLIAEILYFRTKQKNILIK